jgi:hypothetical protein
MGPLSRRCIRKSETADWHENFLLTVIWGVDGLHVVNLMTSQRNFNSEYFMSHVLVSMVAKVSPRGRIPIPHRLQLYLDNWRVHFSKATEQFITENQIGRVPYHLTVLVLHRLTSGFSVMWRLRSQARPSTSQNSCSRQSSSFCMKFSRRGGRGFQPLGREGAMGFTKQQRLLSWVNSSFRETFLDSPSRALAPLLIDLLV